MHPLALACSLACGFLQGEAKDPAELLKTAEGRVAQSKTLHLKASLKRAEDGIETHAVEVEAWLKGDKAKFAYTGKIEDVDAKRTFFAARTSRPSYADATRAVLRAGAFFPLFVVDDGESLDEVFVVTELKLADDEKVGERAAHVLTYTLATINQKKPSTVTVWIDKEKLQPLKRTNKEAGGALWTETFSSWSLDEVLGDDVFKK